MTPNRSRSTSTQNTARFPSANSPVNRRLYVTDNCSRILSRGPRVTEDDVVAFSRDLFRPSTQLYSGVSSTRPPSHIRQRASRSSSKPPTASAPPPEEDLFLILPQSTSLPSQPPISHYLKVISLSGQSIGDDIVDIFVASCLLRCVNLEALDISNNLLTNYSTILLAECFTVLPRLRNVNISANDISTDGAQTIVEKFFRDTLPPIQTSLPASSTSSTSACRGFASDSSPPQQPINNQVSVLHGEELPFVSRAINSLDLSDNATGNESCVYAANAIKRSSSPSQLVLRNIGCGPSGALAVATCAELLVGLDMSENLLFPEISPIQALCLIPARCRHLRQLTLDCIVDPPNGHMKVIHLKSLTPLTQAEPIRRLNTMPAYSAHNDERIGSIKNLAPVPMNLSNTALLRRGNPPHLLKYSSIHGTTESRENYSHRVLNVVAKGLIEGALPLLESFSFMGNTVTDGALPELCAALVSPNCSLRELVLAENNISDVSDLANALLASDRLKLLDLSGNCVSEKSVQKLFNALRTNMSLVELSLSRNPYLGDVALASLTDCLIHQAVRLKGVIEKKAKTENEGETKEGGEVIGGRGAVDTISSVPENDSGGGVSAVPPVTTTKPGEAEVNSDSSRKAHSSLRPSDSSHATNSPKSPSTPFFSTLNHSLNGCRSHHSPPLVPFAGGSAVGMGGRAVRTRHRVRQKRRNGMLSAAHSSNWVLGGRGSVTSVSFDSVCHCGAAWRCGTRGVMRERFDLLGRISSDRGVTLQGGHAVSNQTPHSTVLRGDEDHSLETEVKSDGDDTDEPFERGVKGEIAQRGKKSEKTSDGGTDGARETTSIDSHEPHINSGTGRPERVDAGSNLKLGDRDTSSQYEDDVVGLRFIEMNKWTVSNVGLTRFAGMLGLPHCPVEYLEMCGCGNVNAATTIRDVLNQKVHDWSCSHLNTHSYGTDKEITRAHPNQKLDDEYDPLSFYSPETSCTPSSSPRSPCTPSPGSISTGTSNYPQFCSPLPIETPSPKLKGRFGTNGGSVIQSRQFWRSERMGDDCIETYVVWSPPFRVKTLSLRGLPPDAIYLPYLDEEQDLAEVETREDSDRTTFRPHHSHLQGTSSQPGTNITSSANNHNDNDPTSWYSRETDRPAGVGNSGGVGVASQARLFSTHSPHSTPALPSPVDFSRTSSLSSVRRANRASTRMPHLNEASEWKSRRASLTRSATTSVPTSTHSPVYHSLVSALPSSPRSSHSPTSSPSWATSSPSSLRFVARAGAPMPFTNFHASANSQRPNSNNSHTSHSNADTPQLPLSSSISSSDRSSHCSHSPHFCDQQQAAETESRRSTQVNDKPSSGGASLKGKRISSHSSQSYSPNSPQSRGSHASHSCTSPVTPQPSHSRHSHDSSPRSHISDGLSTLEQRVVDAHQAHRHLAEDATNSRSSTRGKTGCDSCKATSSVSGTGLKRRSVSFCGDPPYMLQESDRSASPLAVSFIDDDGAHHLKSANSSNSSDVHHFNQSGVNNGGGALAGGGHTSRGKGSGMSVVSQMMSEVVGAHCDASPTVVDLRLVGGVEAMYKSPLVFKVARESETHRAESEIPSVRGENVNSGYGGFDDVDDDVDERGTELTDRTNISDCSGDKVSCATGSGYGGDESERGEDMFMGLTDSCDLNVGSIGRDQSALRSPPRSTLSGYYYRPNHHPKHMLSPTPSVSTCAGTISSVPSSRRAAAGSVVSRTSKASSPSPSVSSSSSVGPGAAWSALRDEQDGTLLPVASAHPLLPSYSHLLRPVPLADGSSASSLSVASEECVNDVGAPHQVEFDTPLPTPPHVASSQPLRTGRSAASSGDRERRWNDISHGRGLDDIVCVESSRLVASLTGVHHHQQDVLNSINPATSLNSVNSLNAPNSGSSIQSSFLSSEMRLSHLSSTSSSNTRVVISDRQARLAATLGAHHLSLGAFGVGGSNVTTAARAQTQIGNDAPRIGTGGVDGCGSEGGEVGLSKNCPIGKRMEQ
eukprot:GHVN01034158.1.p1 GENE.GHVN01034158.1~~GHVN01034158.1.p1  ORF type:complete len:1988 (+),score=376.45 GHVN01034158.1:124-6087(+)